MVSSFFSPSEVGFFFSLRFMVYLFAFCWDFFIHVHSLLFIYSWKSGSSQIQQLSVDCLKRLNMAHALCPRQVFDSFQKISEAVNVLGSRSVSVWAWNFVTPASFCEYSEPLGQKGKLKAQWPTENAILCLLAIKQHSQYRRIYTKKW